jgi:signal transduction histidine kinase
MEQRIHDLDWSATPVGAPAAWPQSLKTVVRVLLDSRYAMWMAWGPELTFFCNDAYSPTLGIKKGRALGASARDVWAEIWSDIGPRIDAVLSTGKATWDEGLLLFLERSGEREETYHTFSYSPLPDDSGAIAGMLCVVTEETERVIDERRLSLLRDLAARLAVAKKEKEIFNALESGLAAESRDLPFTLTYLFNADNQAVLSCATGFGVEGVAKSALKSGAVWPLEKLMAGQPELIVGGLEGRLDKVPLGPWERPAEKALLVPIAYQGQSRPAGAFIAALNPNRPFDSAYRGFIDLFVGQLAAALSSVRAFEEERKRAEALAEIDRLKTAFFSNTSHELRTPLTLMLGPLEDLLNRPAPSLNSDDRELLSIAYRNAQRLRKLTNTLLDFARIEAGRVQATYERVDLAAFTAELAGVFRSTVERAGLQFEVDTPALAGPVLVDREMWEKIVFNLLSNACKYTFTGGIRVTLRSAGPQAVLAVEDTGTGIPQSELPKLFDRFHRVEGAHGRTHEGTGIGLALVHELTQLHGGQVWVESTEGNGSKFFVALPFGEAHLPAERIHAAGARATDGNTASPFLDEAARWIRDDSKAGPLAEDGSALAPAETAAAPVIVVADDNADMRSYVRRLLEPHYKVVLAADGRDALELISGHAPDLVVSDVMMPNLDGFGLLAELRANPRTSTIPVMMLSARAGEEARIEGMQSGADDYLAKPFSARDLIARVEHHLSRASLRRTEQAYARKLLQIFEHAPVGIAVLRGPAHVYEVANDAYMELIAHRQVLGRTIREALPELEGQAIVELLEKVYRTGEPFVGKLGVNLVRGDSPAPQKHIFEVAYQPLPDAQGAIEGVVVIAFEVTELENARRNAESASRAKDEFLAMLGHELRNPLAPILTALQIMRLRGITSDEKERDIIERQVRHVVELVDDLLDVSRVTQGKLTLKIERIELAQVVAKAVEQVRPLLEANHHALAIEVPNDGLTVEADPRRLAQVIANLLNNAAKYTEPHGTISIVAQNDGRQRAALHVRDTGVGIAPELLPKVFDLFYQDRQSAERSQGGLGLGLAIVKSLVELHGGDVSAKSKGRGHGSEFTVTLPLSSAHSGTWNETRNVPALEKSNTRRILIVDDNVDAAETLASILHIFGHTTRIAHDGPAGLDAALAFAPDVALLDIGLPVMDGYEVARRMRAQPQLANTRLISLTGYGQQDDRIRSQDAGFETHLVKPIDIEVLHVILLADRASQPR